MADSKPVLLCLAVHAASLDGVGERPLAHSEIVLKRGMRVAVCNARGEIASDGDGEALPPVEFTGNLSAFVNALAKTCHPTGVRTRTAEVERSVVLDGERTTAKVSEHTCFLVDG